MEAYLTTVHSKSTDRVSERVVS